jgi:hypothetical protein
VALVLRFLIGAVVVSAFAALGEAFKPKRFSGLFGAAPSIALVTLAMTFKSDGPGYVAVEARSMALGGFAFAAYCSACILIAKRAWCPVWLAAASAWGVWGMVAFGAWKVLLALGRP